MDNKNGNYDFVDISGSNREGKTDISRNSERTSARTSDRPASRSSERPSTRAASNGGSSPKKPRSAAGKKSKRNSIIIRALCAVLSVILLIGGVGCLYGFSTINSFGYQDLTEATIPDSSGATGSSEADEFAFHQESGSLLNDPYVLNIMLFGTDNAAGLSDTMILLSIDNRHEKIKMTSFLRDTYVSIPGYYPHKLNLSFSLGGAPLAIQTIEGNYGVQIDRYAQVTFSTFKEIVDIMGGVEIELSYDEIAYINAQIQSNGQSEYLYAEPGMVTLNGQQALWYARNRGGYYAGQSFSGDDWDRTDRQRKFLMAVIEQMKDASLTEIVQIVNSVGPMVTTNLKKSEITMLVSNALTYLTYDIEQTHMPSDGNWSYGYNNAGSVILVDDWNQVRYDLAKFVYEENVAD
ncbi:MAG: LCP family protein [Ruminococcus sp.]